MSNLTKFTFSAFGAALVAVGLFVLFSGGLSLPTRQPSVRFHFGGPSLSLLGLSPLALGLLSLSIVRGTVHQESRTTQLILGFGIVSLGLAFALASKA